MYVCVCNGVSQQQLRDSFNEGAKSVEDLQMKTGAGTCCGTCVAMLGDLVKEWGPSVPYEPEPVVVPLTPVPSLLPLGSTGPAIALVATPSKPAGP